MMVKEEKTIKIVSEDIKSIEHLPHRKKNYEISIDDNDYEVEKTVVHGKTLEIHLTKSEEG